ncbi:MAG: Uridylate kinase [Candidatus Amesbacteria bacterium GW2011_GWA2_47_11b]|uniref:Uridylate kinase n=3 Tax=Candidatus Amesiibacteriota TaxID=1752730 RepID=A0A0G1UV38_9BACT|nr:MAG: Uridylate kinase [Microgenomates group bacterium GW2011_GWC1_46_20]KKU58324.1 MAG: Uridylate kinase [Candidatus Amesbacteria bacterium GW2011_GWA2_47_11b]KKU69913.1 MAG: Uridylate kinase [Candidatus Amesbacteria bacterium GW2011_GWA1_47_20]KKU84818.1 MAG: Uridylate kinase [Candidatus Amesbacteria bacterium GW2011_GWC2_47_8]
MFGGERQLGLDFVAIKKLTKYLAKLRKKTRVELAIVIGAGNLFRGRNVNDAGFDRAAADYIGMLGTVMNALSLQGELEMLGTPTRVMSALRIDQVCEPFIRKRAIHHLEKGYVVILAGGTGSPFFTTDSAAALKACELNCEILLKGSNVEGIYDADPRQNKDAKMFKTISFQKALEMGLTVMDNTAYALCQRERIPVVVFNLGNLENIERILAGEDVGTLVTN